MRLEKAIFVNRAPFERLELDFDDSNIFLLSGINGRGKTTILSHIVDSFYELAKEGYSNEFEDAPNKYYRISSNLYTLDSRKPSIVYFRFRMKNGIKNDYIDIRGNCKEDEYLALLPIENTIPYSKIKSTLERSNCTKYWEKSERKDSTEVFSKSIMTYFPAYRYEQPFYLNDPYKTELSFQKDMQFSGYLENPIEVSSDIPQIANWMMDIVLDSELYHGSTSIILKDVNAILTHILFPKNGKSVRIGIGPRSYGAQRLAVVNTVDSLSLYPSIFLMSSGELALLSEFVELVKQADKLGKTCSGVDGIVLIDEIDKHLHIQLQKEVLPLLIAKFPNIQFIVTSHSPFFSLGLAGSSEVIKSVIFDMDYNGCKCAAQNNELYQEVYRMMIAENDQYARKYDELSKQIQQATKPLIITEGKTDWKHLKAAMEALQITDLDIEFHECEDSIGDKKLEGLLPDFVRTANSRKMIAIFDRDNGDLFKTRPNFKTDPYIEIGRNVYAMSIPLVNQQEYGDSISIEHYYKKKDLLKEDEYGRRLFLGSDFFNSGSSKDGKYQTKYSGIQNKIKVNGIIDDKVYDRVNDIEEKVNLAMTKNDFAMKVYEKTEFAKDFDFSEFSHIFDVIRSIVGCHSADLQENTLELITP